MATRTSSRTSSNRRTKAVNYSCSSDGGDDDDDDFTSAAKKSKPAAVKPAAKRTKQTKLKEDAEDEEDVSGGVQSKRACPDENSRRLPLGEKLFERDLKLALELSKDAQLSSKGTLTTPLKNSTNTDRPIASEKTMSSTSAPASTISADTKESVEIAETKDEDDDDDSSYAADDKDYANDGGDDNDDDNDDDYSDSETSGSKPKMPTTKSSASRGSMQTKQRGSAQRKAPGKAPVRPPSKQTATVCSRTGSTLSKNTSSSTSSVPVRSQLVHTVNYPSPSSGLRLGLSRNVRVKPLHSGTTCGVKIIARLN